MAEKSKGWIKVSRDVLDSVIWNYDEPFDDRSAYIDLALRVNYTASEFRPRTSRITYTIHPGQIFTSEEKLADRWHWSKGKVKRYLKMLEERGYLSMNRTANGTIINVITTGDSGFGRTACSTTDSTDDRTNHDTNGGTACKFDGGTRLKKAKKGKESKELQEPKNTAKRSDFDWGNLE